MSLVALWMFTLGVKPLFPSFADPFVRHGVAVIDDLLVTIISNLEMCYLLEVALVHRRSRLLDVCRDRKAFFKGGEVLATSNTHSDASVSFRSGSPRSARRTVSKPCPHLSPENRFGSSAWRGSYAR